MTEQIDWRAAKRLKARLKLMLAGCGNGSIGELMKKGRSSKVLLVGAPIHDNLGDHLLAIAERDLLAEMFPDRSIVEIPTELYMLERYRLQDAIQPDDVVFITGGGWLGDVWKDDDAILRNMIDIFSPRCSVVVLPQTIYFKSAEGDYFNQCMKYWGSLHNCTLCVRERNSFDLLLENSDASDGNCGLLPDAGLTYQYTSSSEKEESKALLCLRADRESSLSQQGRQEIARLLEKDGFSVSSTSTLVDKIVRPDERERRVNAKIDEFARASLVITDRLHGMVFAFLAQTPCIVLDNETHKVSGVYAEWLSSIPSITMVDDVSKVPEALAEMTRADNRDAFNLRRQSQDIWKRMFHGFIKERINGHS